MLCASLDPDKYHLSQLAGLPSPSLVVYREIFMQNIARMRRQLENIAPGSGFKHLRTHVKTHKSLWATGVLLEAGLTSFKSSLQELEMLIDAGAKDIFLAYPLLPQDADFFAQHVARHSSIRFLGQIGCQEHAEHLASAARRYSVEIPVLIDVDIGNHRTGSRVEQVGELARAVRNDAQLGPLKIVGIHAYDGHNNSKDPEQRRAGARETMGATMNCVRQLEELDLPVSLLQVAGTPPFAEDLNELMNIHKVDAQVEVSPGTWVYWDTNYDSILPERFEFAALVYSQIMDRPCDDVVCLNLGNKRWSVDAGPMDLFSIPGLEFISVNEEHTKLRLTKDAPNVRIGDPVLFVPRHVCTTVNLWEHFAIVGADGTIEQTAEPVTARNR